MKKPKRITRRRVKKKLHQGASGVLRRVRGGASVLCHCGRPTRVLRTERAEGETMRTRRCSRGHRFYTRESKC